MANLGMSNTNRESDESVAVSGTASEADAGAPLPSSARPEQPNPATESTAAEQSADLGAIANTPGDETRRLLRSPFTWLILALTVAALAALAFMALNLHPVDSGKIRGPGDEAAPNAPPDYRRR